MKKILFLLLTVFSALGFQSCLSNKQKSGGYDYKAVITKIAVEELKLRYQTLNFTINVDSSSKGNIYIDKGKLFSVQVDSTVPGMRKIIVTPDYNLLEEVLTKKREKYERLVRKKR